MRTFITLIIMYAVIIGYAFISPLQAPTNCKVLIEALSGEYTGDCKKGLANGKGKAVGTDTYEGDFKKGFPHGIGTYTWANGDLFKGEFKKGKKSGAGEKSFVDGRSPEKGYWLDDEYIGTDQKPYKIITKTVSINRISFKRLAAEPNQLDVKFTRLGKPVKGKNISIQGAFGVIMSNSDFNTLVKVHSFPMQGGLSFAALTTRDAGGRGGGDYTDGSFEFKINQTGSWEVVIEMQGTE